MAGRLIIRQHPVSADTPYALEQAELVLDYMKKQHPDVEVLLEIDSLYLEPNKKWLKVLGEDHD